MTHPPEFGPSAQPIPLGRHVLQGAGLAFVLVALFMLFFYQGAQLKFGLWTVLPLLTVPTAGAFGGLLYHLLAPVRQRGGWQKMVINVFTLVGYCAGLWISLVAAFAATGLWD